MRRLLVKLSTRTCAIMIDAFLELRRPRNRLQPSPVGAYEVLATKLPLS